MQENLFLISHSSSSNKQTSLSPSKAPLRFLAAARNSFGLPRGWGFQRGGERRGFCACCERGSRKGRGYSNQNTHPLHSRSQSLCKFGLHFFRRHQGQVSIVPQLRAQAASCPRHLPWRDLLVMTAAPSISDSVEVPLQAVSKLEVCPSSWEVRSGALRTQCWTFSCITVLKRTRITFHGLRTVCMRHQLSSEVPHTAPAEVSGVARVIMALKYEAVLLRALHTVHALYHKSLNLKSDLRQSPRSLLTSSDPGYFVGAS